MPIPMLPLSPDSPAYCLFIEEVDKHLAFAHESLTGGPGGITPDIARRLGASFHTIRGSAGFFGLSEVADLAKRIEEHFFAVAGGEQLDLTRMQPLVESVTNLTADLPRPPLK